MKRRTSIMMSHLFRLPFESMKSSSPLSTLIMILTQCLIEMFAFSCSHEKWILVLQSGNWRNPSRSQGPRGSRQAGVVSSDEVGLIQKSASGDCATASGSSESKGRSDVSGSG